jgi:tetratricopeptide (TPR) repeat protein
MRCARIDHVKPEDILASNIQGKLSLKDGFRLARTVGQYLEDQSNYTAEEFISVAEKAIRKHPDEWVILFSLGDKYQEIGRYVDSIKVLGRSVELRPKDLRSVYALTTAYNLLTRAGWTREQADRANLRIGLTGYNRIDPELANEELAKAGLTLETAASQAIRWFERALELNPDNQSKKQIQMDLEVLYKRFPNLRH